MLLYASSLLYVLYYINFSTVISNNTTETINTNMYFLLEGVCSMMYVLHHIFTYGESAAFQEILEMSTILSQKKYNELSKLIYAKDVIGFLLLLGHVSNCFTHEIVLTLRNLCTLYTLMVNFLLDMFYIDLVYVVKACFKKLNKSLQELTFMSDANKSCNGVSNPLSPQVKFLLLTKLKILEKKHLQISHVVEGMNNDFLIRNIIMTTSTFIIVTFNVYYQLLYPYTPLSDNPAYHNTLWYSPYISAVFFYFVKFGMVIWTCELATNEAQKIKIIIHDVLGSTTDAEAKYEAQLFSLQILHKNNMFTAKAIDMNAMLLSQVVGGITMYIMILLQFLLNTAVCRKIEAS
ncbi:uncharacterized protein LOC108631546 [Ceratina calcarata]|uniref:Gustatory receptor n=1 Tax=Ceratina calcarata TaxID=156304 RepID=A0AAJ7JEX8_9HYME|nr:uncharacterized protein LOC108631546 [Ceratina calcarata]